MGEVVVVKALLQVAEFLLEQLGTAMHPDRRISLQNFVEDPARQAAVECTERVAAERARDFDPALLYDFRQMQLGVSTSEAEELVGSWKMPSSSTL